MLKRIDTKLISLSIVQVGLMRDVRFHSLPNRFATHLLERKIDTHYLKDKLVHFNIKTTERYIHVSRLRLIHISSPLDDFPMK